MSLTKLTKEQLMPMCTGVFVDGSSPFFLLGLVTEQHTSPSLLFREPAFLTYTNREPSLDAPIYAETLRVFTTGSTPILVFQPKTAVLDLYWMWYEAKHNPPSFEATGDAP